jgi:hypothetical protein
MREDTVTFTLDGRCIKAGDREIFWQVQWLRGSRAQPCPTGVIAFKALNSE